MKSKSKVCVIGSNSFSAIDFVDLLLEDSRYEILGVSRSPKKEELFLPQKLLSSPNYTFQQFDLNHDVEELSKALDQFQPDYIVNFAAQSEVAPSWLNPDHWYQTNVVAVTKLAHMLKDKKYLKKYVHISSPEVYGTCSGKVKEHAPLNPSTPYAASKAGGDLSLGTYFKNFGFPVILVRATNVYGPRQQLFKIIPRTAIYLKSSRIIELHGGGEAVKSYIHIRDVSLGEKSIMENGKIGETYHLSPDSGVKVKDVVNSICCMLKHDPTSSTRNVEERLGQDFAYVIDSTKARKELGWKPEIGIEQGIFEVCDWVEKQWNLIKKQPLEYVHKV
jgi:dTDP-glucose 4,6-dehydratase